MRLIDRRFRVAPLQYVWQCLLAAVAVAVVLLTMDAVKQAVDIAALGASAFIVFTMPTLKTSGPRYIIGGYVIGIGVGVLGWALFHLLFHVVGIEAIGADRRMGLMLFGGLAVGLSIFLMTITDTEHPPASGVALGLVVDPQWDLEVLAVILLAAIALSVVKALLRPALRNLL